MNGGTSEGSTEEIERVYLLDRLPALPASARAHQIEQGYLPDEPAAAGSFPEGRLRRTVRPDGATRYTHTIKRGAGITRTEIERAIEETEFAALWPGTAGRRLKKTRFKVPVGSLVWEIDQFADLDLVLAEVELPSADAEVVPPPWLAPHVVRELTWNPRYRNYALATEGLPDPAE